MKGTRLKAFLPFIIAVIVAIIFAGQPAQGSDLTYTAEDFHYNWTPDTNRYEWKVIEHHEKSNIVYTIKAVYYKRPRNFHVESMEIGGKSGVFEARVNDDPILYDFNCDCQILSGDFWALPDLCIVTYGIETTLCAIARTLPANLRAQLRAQYENINNVNPTEAPLPVSPTEGSVQNGNDRIKFEVFLPFRYLKPCENWSFRLELNRWDPTVPRKNKWVTAPYSGDNSFGGFEGENFDCRGITDLKLNPGRYRFKCQARNVEGWTTPWSYWFEFSVKTAISAESAQKFMQTSRIIEVKLNQPAPWFPGENHSVSWQSTSVPGKVKIFLVKGNSTAALLTANRFEWSLPGGVANNGYWRHNLPQNLPPDEHYRVLVQSVENPDIKGFSEYFPIRMKMNAAAFKGMKKNTHIPAGANIHPQKKPTFKPGAAAKMAKLKFLKLTSPRGMETWYLGETHAITWRASGIEGRIRIVLEDRNGKRQTLNGLVGTDVTKGRFDWKIGGNIKPGSMYKIYLKTPDGKVKSHKSGGFNIKMKLKKLPGKKLRHLN